MLVTFAALTLRASAVTLPAWYISKFNPSGSINSSLPQDAAGVNNSGVVVGRMSVKLTGGGYRSRAYTRDASGVQTNFDAPDADPTSVGTWATAINNNGDVIGAYLSSNSKLLPFIRSAGVIQTMDLGRENDNLDIVATGINSNLTVVGNTYVNEIKFGSYIQTSIGVFQWFGCSNPGAAFTYLVAINDQGTIIGYYTDSNDLNAVAHPFWTNGVGSSCTALPTVPGAQATYWTGINNHNQMVGWYTSADGTQTHGLYGDLSGSFVQFDLPGSRERLH
jgi:hypothetical protein